MEKHRRRKNEIKRHLLLIDYVHSKEGGICMATSSITHNFVISDPQSVKKFISAIDEADRNRMPVRSLPGRQLTDPEEIMALMAKRKKKNA